MPKENPFIRTPIAVLISTICSAVPFAAAAEIDSQETIQVWGTQVSNTSSLLSEDIALKQADHLSDLLRDEAGIDIGGSHSMVQGVNIRGVDELDLNISIDGVTQNNNMFHHSGNLLINSDILQAVDVNTGTNSVITGGLSGGVAFETKDAKDLLYGDEKMGARVSASYGSNDYYSTSATLYSQLNDNFDALAYFTFSDKENFDDGDGNEVTGNEGQVKNGLIKLGWDVNDANRIEVSYDQYNDAGDYYQKTNFGGGYNTDNDLETMDIEYQRTTLALGYELDLGNAINLNASVYENEISYQPEGTEGNSTHSGYKLLAESNLAMADMTHAVRYGLEGYHQVSKAITSGVTTEKESADSFAVYAENEIGLSKRFYLTPGVRYNYYKVNMNSSSDSLNKTFTDTTFGLAAKYLASEQWTLNASVTELFQGPGLRETYTVYSTEFDDHLKAETGINSEIGAAFEEHNIIGLDYFAFSVTLFETNIDDYIDNWSVGKDGDYNNDGDYRIQGYESTLALTKAAFDARLTYAHSDSKNKETGDALRYEVGDSLSLGLGYELPSLDLTLNWRSQVTFDLDADSENDVEKAGYDVHSLTTRWMPRDIENLTFTAGIENIFNEQYYSHASFSNDSIKDYEPGRNLKLSVAYVF